MIACRFEVPGWGTGLLHCDEGDLIDLDEPAPRERRGTPVEPPPAAVDAIARIGAYLGGEDVRFDDIDVGPACERLGLTALQRRMVDAVRTVPRGETASYREIAELAGHPRAPRSAGAACARGPLSIIVPYHRVIRADGDIGWYGELGAERKRRLLALEGVHAR